jgi:hypothetical protein
MGCGSYGLVMALVRLVMLNVALVASQWVCAFMCQKVVMAAGTGDRAAVEADQVRVQLVGKEDRAFFVAESAELQFVISIRTGKTHCGLFGFYRLQGRFSLLSAATGIDDKGCQ